MPEENKKDNKKPAKTLSLRGTAKMPEEKLFIERPEQVPEEAWGWLPAFPFEYPGICAILPLPRVILDKFCKPPVAEFKVGNLVITPTEVNPGQVVTISCLVENIGTETGTKTINLGGDFVAEQSVTLEPGESKSVSFEVTPAVAKTYSVSVNGLSGSFKAVEKPVADIRVEDLMINPSEVMIGEKVTISVRATNYGTESGTKKIVCNVT
ncbi:unnamed protein product [marine sediment metagenome]|uniref:CARDB domain-containing protein n=1 Tax=marine sediment metagenome TaxID=412755 RepID=X1R7B9_9ZZZZ